MATLSKAQHELLKSIRDGAKLWRHHLPEKEKWWLEHHDKDYWHETVPAPTARSLANRNLIEPVRDRAPWQLTAAGRAALAYAEWKKVNPFY